MFLATTALSEFWEKEQEILFLGPWCLRNGRTEDWNGLRWQIMPSPWDDRRRFYDAAHYLDQFSESMLDRLAEYLNVVHQVSYSPRYWRILIGPWLLHFIHAVYDRYVLLTEAFKFDPGLHTIVLDPQCYRTPRDTLETFRWLSDDRYNLQVVSHQLALTGYSFPSRINNESLPRVDRRRSASSNLKRLARKSGRLAGECIGRILRTEWEIALCDTYLSSKQVMNIILGSHFRALALETMRNEWSFTIPTATFDSRRHGLARLDASGAFEKLLVELLPQNFPTLYLEGYRYARTEVAREIRRIPPVIVSAVGWYVTEPFKFVAAEAAETSGSRLIAMQHGGGYGLFRSAPLEEHELRIADRFMVWGWAENGDRSYRNLPSPPLSLLYTTGYKNQCNKLSKSILYVADAYMPYLIRFHSSPQGIRGEKSIRWQVQFLEALPAVVRQAVVFRRYPGDHRSAIRDEIRNRFSDVRWDDNSSFYQTLRNSRLVVIDHSGTSFLEALVMGVPTLLFLDPQYSEVREGAEPCFESLRKVGILWESPQSAAAKLAEVYDDPWPWWSSEAVQEARRIFVNRYALGRGDWLDCWVKALQEEVLSSQVKKKSEGSRPGVPSS
jgi:putative transferase (TIGR04331 family)